MNINDIEGALQALDSASCECGTSRLFIEVRKGESEVVIGGNSCGLVRLALELVRLSQKLPGAHMHIDETSLADVAEIDLVLRVSKEPW